MTKRTIGILLCALCLCLHWLPFHGHALGTEDAVEPIRPAERCALTVAYVCDGTAFEGLSVKLYKIAEVSADFQYSLTEPFAHTGLILNGIRTTGEWDVVRTTLEAAILADSIPADRTAATDAQGRVVFEDLDTGMYLAVAEEAGVEELHCYFDPALVALPGLDPEGRWQYQVEVHAKGAILPPIDPDETIELSVLKLWRGDEVLLERPKSVEIEIFRNGVSYETVTLSEENNWYYSWTAQDDGASWMVVERNVPEGYIMTLEVRDTAFIVTNDLDMGDPPPDPPKTGDTVDLLSPIVLMGICGSLLIILGVSGKRNER